jgi:DNA polymerase III subunit delta
MIIKQFEINKISSIKNNCFLFYGNNEGLKNQSIKNYFEITFKKNIYHYEEKEILENSENFFNSIISKSFFENEKLIIVNRVSDKVLNIINEVIDKKIEDLTIILNAGILEKKSKLRTFFEKDKKLICVPFYEDNSQTLIGLVNDFFRKNKIPMSQQGINLIVERSRGDRQNLNNELEKIESFIKNKNKVEIDEIIKLTNLAENYNVSELVDSCLSKNKRKTINILNENNYSLEDCILIIRTFLIKAKRLLKLCAQTQNKNEIDLTISKFKPPIFWKDKIIVKQQMQNWSHKDTENLIYKINEIELLIKKNSINSLNILSDFIIEQSTATNS